VFRTDDLACWNLLLNADCIFKLSVTKWIIFEEATLISVELKRVPCYKYSTGNARRRERDPLQ
jgi:hypothetical protein